MNGIYHKIGIRSEPEQVVDALTTKTGLAGWWTREVEGPFAKGNSAIGEAIRFRFGEKGGFDMKVKEVGPARVSWECIAGPEDWLGSNIDFDLQRMQSPDGAMTVIFFRHRDWQKESEFTAHCSMKWATFLLSLKELVETGRGQPAPDDFKIDEFN